MIEFTLNNLVQKNLIKHWSIQDVKPTDISGQPSNFRHTQILNIIFNDDTSLILETFCSGADEHSGFVAL